MHHGKLVFAQLMEHLPLHTFRRCVAKYPSRYPALKFSHLDQFLCMAFAQLTFRESLRDIETCLRAYASKLYHLGIRGGIARSTLADANEKRDWRIYQDFAMGLIQVARKLYAQSLTADPTLVANTWALFRLFWGRRNWENLVRLLDAEGRDLQLKRLSKVKAERDPAAVKKALAALAKSAEGDDNLMHKLIDCANAYCTVGEMVSTLKVVWGEFQQPAVF